VEFCFTQGTPRLLRDTVAAQSGAQQRVKVCVVHALADLDGHVTGQHNTHAAGHRIRPPRKAGGFEKDAAQSIKSSRHAVGGVEPFVDVA